MEHQENCKCGIHNTTFTIKLEKNWFIKQDFFKLEEYEYKLLVTEDPYQKWWELVLQYVTFGWIEAGWYYQVKKI